MGRPTKLTEKVREQIVSAVREGCYQDVAARAAGIAPSTFYNWKARGEEGGKRNAIYVEFLDELTRAEAEAEQLAVHVWRKAFGNDWRAAMEYLARRHPENWTRRENVKVEHGGSVKVEGVESEIEDLMAKLGAGGET